MIEATVFARSGVQKTMNESTTTDEVAELRASLTAVKRQIAKVVAQSQVGGDRKVRREMARSLEGAKRRGRNLQRTAEDLLTRDSLTLEERADLEQATRFLTQLQAFQAL